MKAFSNILLSIFMALLAGAVSHVSLTECHAAFYKYIDENGVPHFVDDPAKIPAKYSRQAETYEEKTDRMSREQIQALEEKRRREERENAERLELERKIEEEVRKTREEYIRKAEKILERMEEAGNFDGGGFAVESAGENETPVSVRGSSVLVPVTIGMGREEIVVDLILDTGAEAVTVHQSAVEPLRLRDFRNTRVRVVGGGLIDARVVRFDYVKVGPHARKFVDALVIDHEGPVGRYDGLLGMNFLRNYQYVIDLKNRVIRWK